MRETDRQLLGIDTYYLLSRRSVNGGAERAAVHGRIWKSCLGLQGGQKCAVKAL